MTTNEQVKDVFFEFEEDHTSRDLTIRGFPIYDLLRFQIEIEFRRAQQKSLASPASYHKSLMLTLKKKLYKIWARRSMRQQHPSLDHVNQMRPAPILFVSTSALVFPDGVSIELFNELEYYHSRGMPINFVQPTYMQQRRPARSHLYDTFLPLQITQGHLDRREENTLYIFLKSISTYFNVDFTSNKKCWSNLLASHFERARLLEDYIRKSNAKAVMARSVFTEVWLSIACQHTGIDLIEVQHGVLGTDNIYFQSANKEQRSIFPDYILTLGEYWQQVIIGQNSHFDETNTSVIGSREFDAADHDDIIRQRRVLVTTQLDYGDNHNIKDFVTEFVQDKASELHATGIRLAIRPHPSEQASSYDTLLQQFPEIIEIEDAAKTSLYKSILRSACVFASTSTCLYEALALGRQAISMERFRGLVEAKDLIFINTTTDLFDTINNILSKPSPEKKPYVQSFRAETLDRVLAWVTSTANSTENIAA